MSVEWDYSKLVQRAKECGGPEKLIETIKKYSFEQGLKKGKRIQGSKMIIVLAGGAALFTVGQKSYHFLNEKVIENKIAEMKARKAEEEIIAGIKNVEIEQAQSLI